MADIAATQQAGARAGAGRHQGQRVVQRDIAAEHIAVDRAALVANGQHAAVAGLHRDRVGERVVAAGG